MTFVYVGPKLNEVKMQNNVRCSKLPTWTLGLRCVCRVSSHIIVAHPPVTGEASDFHYLVTVAVVTLGPMCQASSEQSGPEADVTHRGWE